MHCGKEKSAPTGHKFGDLPEDARNRAGTSQRRAGSMSVFSRMTYYQGAVKRSGVYNGTCTVCTQVRQRPEPSTSRQVGDGNRPLALNGVQHVHLYGTTAVYPCAS